MRQRLLSIVLIVPVLLLLGIPVPSMPIPVASTRQPGWTAVARNREFLDAATRVPGVRFVHRATGDNSSANWTYIDHPLTHGNPDAMVFVTQNWNPGGVGGTYNDHAIGVWYDIGAQEWAVFNQDLATMPEGAAFNVLIPTAGADAFVHTAAAANIISNWTYIDHPLTNENPNAIVLVTQNWNPGGGFGIYNDRPIGVWYDAVAGRWAIFNQDQFAMPVGADFNVLIPPAGSDTFVHTATAANSSGHVTALNHAHANGNPNAILLVTQNWNPGGMGGTYNNHAFGVWYSSTAKRWHIFNQDFAAMPEGAAFSIRILTTESAAFVHTATAGNIAGHYTYIDHSLTNDDPNAIVLVTPNWNPGGVGGTYNDHAIGVWYSSGAKKWAIFNQDFAGMPEGAAFNVLIPSVDTSVFVHVARAGNSTENFTYIDHPLTNGKPNALVFVTQNWNPSGVGDTYNDHAIGVWYSDSAQKWSIFNQDDSSFMPVDAAFNVLVASAGTSIFVHTATAANIYGNYTLIEHPLTTESPNRLVFATQNWNPGGGSGTYNDHPIGVWYSDAPPLWSVFNQDNTSSMPIGADFNVLVVAYRLYLPAVARSWAP